MSDVQAFVQYYLTLQILGLAVWPLMRRLFPHFPDRGWAFTKILGILLVSWITWWLGSLKLAPLARTTLVIIIAGIALVNWGTEFLAGRHQTRNAKLKTQNGKSKLKTGKATLDPRPSTLHLQQLILTEELLFLSSFIFWTYVRGFSPEIRGLEKFMDYGFMLSILRGNFFPPLDHFLSGETINYYYFGHLIAAMLTRLSGVLPEVTFNFQIANLFALTILGGFSIGTALRNPFGDGSSRDGGYQHSQNYKQFRKHKNRPQHQRDLRTLIISGLLTALFIAVIGNLHTLINLPREGEKYWYPTATRLIPNTIHEFPIYSFVVADLHGHVSDLPIVLLVLGLLVSYVFMKKTSDVILNNSSADKGGGRGSEGSRWNLFRLRNNSIGILRSLTLPQDDRRKPLTLLSLSLAIGAMYATNSWDFPIYWTLTGFVFLYLYWQKDQDLIANCTRVGLKLLPFFLLSILLFLPFHLSVRPIAKGIGLVRDRSQPYLWLQMWGFHLTLTLFFVGFFFRKKIRTAIKPESIVKSVAGALGVKIQIPHPPESATGQPANTDKTGDGSYLYKRQSGQKNPTRQTTATIANHFALILIVLSGLLIILPEIIYMKDIYPTHYRANTMFKFFYQAWVMLGIALSYGMLRVLDWIRENPSFWGNLIKLTHLFLFTAVLFYPYISLRQSTNRFRFYKGINGTAWLDQQLPNDRQAIDWLNKNITGQPILLEAVGESYTDYARISSNTGIPTVLGWPVHEWLWRGSYDEAGRRTADVQTIYETTDLQQTQDLLKKYRVDLVYLGQMEEEKYPNLQKEKFVELGEVVYENQGVRIYEIHSDVSAK